MDGWVGGWVDGWVDGPGELECVNVVCSEVVSHSRHAAVDVGPAFGKKSWVGGLLMR